MHIFLEKTNLRAPLSNTSDMIILTPEITCSTLLNKQRSQVGLDALMCSCAVIFIWTSIYV